MTKVVTGELRVKVLRYCIYHLSMKKSFLISGARFSYDVVHIILFKPNIRAWMGGGLKIMYHSKFGQLIAYDQIFALPIKFTC